MIEIPQVDDSYRVVPLPRFGQGGKWRTEAMRSYSRPVLLWFTRGQGRITVAGSTRGYGAHNAIFLPPGTMHGFEMTGQIFGSIVYFSQSTNLNLPGEPVHFRFRDANQQAELNGLIDNLQRESTLNMPDREQVLELHGGLLAVWLDRQFALQPESILGLDRTRRLTAAYSALIERDFKSGKSVNEYAAELGVTPTHLSRVCNIACGRSASALIADRTYFEARSLLTTTRRPIKEIARTLGFTSAAYFTRAFQKNTGQTPSVFRRAH